MIMLIIEIYILVLYFFLCSCRIHVLIFSQVPCHVSISESVRIYIRIRASKGISMGIMLDWERQKGSNMNTRGFLKGVSGIQNNYL